MLAQTCPAIHVPSHILIECKMKCSGNCGRQHIYRIVTLAAWCKLIIQSAIHPTVIWKCGTHHFTPGVRLKGLSSKGGFAYYTIVMKCELDFYANFDFVNAPEGTVALWTLFQPTVRTWSVVVRQFFQVTSYHPLGVRLWMWPHLKLRLLLNQNLKYFRGRYKQDSLLDLLRNLIVQYIYSE